MNEYIFYTDEGFTIAPNENFDVENCQVLGRANGNNDEEALQNLVKANPWISDAGFSTSDIFKRQILTDEQRNDIHALLDYLCANHNEDTCGKESHISYIINRLRNI